MAYVKIIYQNSPSTATPINAQNLNHMDDGIAENDRRLNELETAGVVNKFNGRSGNITPTKGDYDIADIGATDGQDGYVPVWRNSGTEQEPNWGFEMEQQGGSGHKILDADGSEMAQEDALQFADSFVSDDDVNGKTVVENVKEVTLAELSQATERGMYLATDEESVPIGEIEEDVVSVTADGNSSYSALFNAFYSQSINRTKVTRDSVFVFENPNGTKCYARHSKTYADALFFTEIAEFAANTLFTKVFKLAASSSFMADRSNTTDSVYESQLVPQGTKISLYYGTSSGIVELNTEVSYSTAERKIGKWIDGSDLYEKTIDFGALPNATSKQVNHGIANLGTIVEIKGIAIRSSDNASKPLPFSDPTATKIISLEATTSVIYTETGTNYSAYNAWVTLRYTKS